MEVISCEIRWVGEKKQTTVLILSDSNLGQAGVQMITKLNKQPDKTILAKTKTSKVIARTKTYATLSQTKKGTTI